MELYPTAEPSTGRGRRGRDVRRVLGTAGGYNPASMLDLREHLQNLFGLDDFRPSQREVVEDVLRGKDVLCVMPTGAGKSLCYQLPAAISDGLTIVVSPLISLMEDQVQQLRDEGIPCALLNSTLSPGERRQVMRDVESGFKGLLYVAPERFVAMDFAPLLDTLRPKLFAVSWWIRRGNPDHPTITATALGLVALLFGSVGGWLGGELVYRLSVGVDFGTSNSAAAILTDESSTARVLDIDPFAQDARLFSVFSSVPFVESRGFEPRARITATYSARCGFMSGSP